MISADDNRLFFPAWGISLTLHGAVVGLALAFATQVKPILPEDVFKWEVALVEAAKSESRSEQVQSVVTPEQPPARVAPPSRTKRVPETYQAVKPLEQKVEPPPTTIEPVQSIEQKVEPLHPREEPIEPMAESVAVATPIKPVEPTTDVPVAAASHEASTPQETPQSLPQENSMDDAPMQVAKVAAPGSDVKLDNRWVGESLWRRVAELKRYPNSARMNGQEGKVILKAIIRSDGQLADVSVQKSSGHSVLDTAAMEAVKLACPLHMKHAIGKPMIVVSLPIVYSLAN
ncbi:MAG: energy transducer TonB [Nitrospira sp.]|nr:energy transducer TonB [Nitrospira sp.]